MKDILSGLESTGSLNPSGASGHFLQSIRTEYWQKVYSNTTSIGGPSPYCLSVCDEMDVSGELLEVGCGNGRDSFYFASQGHRVIGIDTCPAAIDFCRSVQATNTTFLCGSLASVAPQISKQPTAIYSRFCLHAMTEIEQSETLEMAHRLLPLAGKLYVECRSILDPMADMGESLSPTERNFGHYRRFIVREELEQQLRNIGFELLYVVEADGLAVHGDENPVVIRVTAQKSF